MTVVPNMVKVGLAICIPFGGRPVTPEWALSFAQQSYPLNFYTRWHTTKGKPVAEAREEMLDDAIKHGAKYMICWDDDVQPPLWGARQLLYTLQQHEADKVAVVTGVYFSKSDPPEPVIFRHKGKGAYWNWKIGNVFDVEEAGTGFMAINLEMLKDVPKPWFQMHDEPITSIEHGGVIRWSLSEDLFFCGKVIESGHRILVDSKVLCIHWDQASGNFWGCPETSYPARDERVAKALTIPGWMSYKELVQLANWAEGKNLIVEVGSFQGRSTRVLADNGGIVIACDDWKGPRDTTENYENLQDTFIVNLRDHIEVGRVKLLVADHRELESSMPFHGKVDMAFIDGSHEYEDVKRDILYWSKTLSPDGILCGHDANWHGVERALNELLPDIELVPNTSLWWIPSDKLRKNLEPHSEVKEVYA